MSNNNRVAWWWLFGIESYEELKGLEGLEAWKRAQESKRLTVIVKKRTLIFSSEKAS